MNPSTISPPEVTEVTEVTKPINYIPGFVIIIALLIILVFQNLLLMDFSMVSVPPVVSDTWLPIKSIEDDMTHTRFSLQRIEGTLNDLTGLTRQGNLYLYKLTLNPKGN